MPNVVRRGLAAILKEELRLDGGWLTVRNLTNRVGHLIPPESVARERGRVKGKMAGCSSIISQTLRHLDKSFCERRKNEIGIWEYRYTLIQNGDSVNVPSGSPHDTTRRDTTGKTQGDGTRLA